MRILTLLFLIFYHTVVLAQEILTLKVFEKETNTPIEGVSIVYSKSTVGTFTNSDGVASIYKKDGEHLLLTHINYDTVKVGISSITTKDTLNYSMNIKPVLIPEVAISYFDIKKALQYVLSNYAKLYLNTPTEKVGNFKEIVLVNGEIRRLILSKLSWWSKDYSLSQKNNPVFKLIDLEINKNTPLNIFTDIPEVNQNGTKSGYLELRSVIHMLYLDAYLSSFLKYNSNIIGRIESSDEYMTVVSFQSDWTTVNNQTTRSTGNFTFDKHTKAILDFNNSVEYKEVKVHKVGPEKKTFEQHTLGMISNLSFERNRDGKLSLNKFELKSLNKIRYNEKDYRNDFVNTFYKLYEYSKKRMDKKGAIDIRIPIYRNAPQKFDIENTKSINLTKKEADFIEYGK